MAGASMNVTLQLGTSLCHFVMNLYSFLWEILLASTTCNSTCVQNILNSNEVFEPLAVSIYQTMKNTYAAPEQGSA